MVHRQKPFLDVYASFIGFPKGEYDDMVVMVTSHGGHAVVPTDPRCTHIVICSAFFRITFTCDGGILSLGL